MTFTYPGPEPRAATVELTAEQIRVDLLDGRAIIVPLEWFPRLFRASPADRANWRIICDGERIQWPSIDEDLSVISLLRGTGPKSVVSPR
jgi:hypothetical protein